MCHRAIRIDEWDERNFAEVKSVTTLLRLTSCVPSIVARERTHPNAIEAIDRLGSQDRSDDQSLRCPNGFWGS